MGSAGRSFAVSAALHALALSVGFGYAVPRSVPEKQTLVAVLVNAKTQKPQESAQMIAQANLSAGGEEESEQAPAANPFERGLEASFAEARSKRAAAGKSGSGESAAELADKVRRLELANKEAARLLQKQAMEGQNSQQAGQSDEQSESAKLAASLEQRMQAYAARPKKVFVGANAQESALAEWVERWQRKIEKTAADFYPENVKGKRGELIMTSAVRSDGSVESIDIERKSGVQGMDEAAKRILALAGPFEAFGPELKKTADIVYITRKWKFTPAGFEELGLPSK